MSMSPTIYQFWNNQPPHDVQVLLRSWSENAAGFGYRLFNDEAAIQFIEEHFDSDVAAAYRMSAVAAMRADLFRYCVLFVCGGIYADADTELKGDLAHMYHMSERGLLFRRHTRIANDFIIVRKKNDPLLQYAIEQAVSNIKARISQNVWEVTGPGIMTHLHRGEDPRRKDLFARFHILSGNELKNYVEFHGALEYKGSASHWLTAKSSGSTIYSE